MGHKFAELTFTPNVKAEQAALGSRRAYQRFEQGEDHQNVLGPQESAFISMRDSFYMATVSETGWPYIQHRGGPAGFLKVLDENGLGSASNLIAAIAHVQEINGYGRRLLIHGVNISVGYKFDPEWFACGQSPVCIEVEDDTFGRTLDGRQRALKVAGNILRP